MSNVSNGRGFDAHHLEVVTISWSAMASKVVPKLHLVRLIRSGISKPYWTKRTLEALGLTKMHRRVIHKNTPSVNGMLMSVKEHIEVRPITIRTDLANSPTGRECLLDNGQYFISQEKLDSIGQSEENRLNQIRNQSSNCSSESVHN